MVTSILRSMWERTTFPRPFLSVLSAFIYETGGNDASGQNRGLSRTKRATSTVSTAFNIFRRKPSCVFLDHSRRCIGIVSLDIFRFVRFFINYDTCRWSREWTERRIWEENLSFALRCVHLHRDDPKPCSRSSRNWTVLHRLETEDSVDAPKLPTSRSEKHVTRVAFTINGTYGKRVLVCRVIARIRRTKYDKESCSCVWRKFYNQTMTGYPFFPLVPSLRNEQQIEYLNFVRFVRYSPLSVSIG